MLTCTFICASDAGISGRMPRRRLPDINARSASAMSAGWCATKPCEQQSRIAPQFVRAPRADTEREACMPCLMRNPEKNITSVLWPRATSVDHVSPGNPITTAAAVAGKAILPRPVSALGEGHE